MNPKVEFPPVTPFTFQVTEVLGAVHHSRFESDRFIDSNRGAGG